VIEQGGARDVGVRSVLDSDVDDIASIFIRAFPESVRHYYGASPPPVAGFRDIFAFLSRAQRRNFLVYEECGVVLGYVIVPRTMGRVWAKALLGGYVFLWVAKWLSGRYGISFRRARTILANKLLFAGYSGEQLLRGHAQVLSVAVDPRAQGRGIGRQLIQAGLALLRQQGACTVKLEVRPGNEPARRIYSSLGFREAGRSRDSQGQWIVMVAHLEPDPRTS